MSILNELNQAGVVGNASERPRVRRGRYDEIIWIGSVAAAAILKQFEPCLPSTFVSFDHAKRGEALNLDLYGYCADENVAIVQVRHTFRRARRHFLNGRKTYVLCGFNEITAAPFRHPVSSHTVRASVRKRGEDPAAAIRAAQKWMWRVTDKQLAASVRQGDVLLVPGRGEPTGSVVVGEVCVVGGSHEVRARRILLGDDGLVHAWAPALWHLKGQHDPLFADDERWYSVRIAREAEAWDWSQRIGD